MRACARRLILQPSNLKLPTSSEALSEAELNALQALASGGFSSEGLAEATQTAYQALAGTMQDAVTNSESEGKVHESGTPCEATERDCPLKHKEAGEETEKKSSWDTGTFTNAQKQQAITDFAKLRKEKTAELREKIGGTIESPIPGIPAVKVTGSSIKEMLNNKAIWSSMALGASVDVHIEAAEKTREYVKTATPGKPVPTTDPADPIKEKIYLDKQFTAKDGNTYTARYMVRVFRKQGMQPDIYFMNCRK